MVSQEVTLDHQVGGGKIRSLQAKVEAFQKWPLPQNKKQLQPIWALVATIPALFPTYNHIAAFLADNYKTTIQARCFG